MQFETIQFDKNGSVAIITLNRPDRVNAINRKVLDELQEVCSSIEADDKIRAVVLTGAGKTFSSGFDLKEQANKPPKGVKEWEPVLRSDFDGVMQFWHLSKPTIAAVRGYVLAGAFEMMLACDMTIAAEGSIFGEPELKFGAGIVVMLAPWYVGPKLAKEIILMADDQISAKRALELGFINAIVPEGEEVAQAVRYAEKLSNMDPMIVQRTKSAINRSYEFMGLLQGLEMALDVDLKIEGEGSEDKKMFLKIAREEGLSAALKWRENRFVMTK